MPVVSSPQTDALSGDIPVIRLSDDQWELVRRYLGLARRAGQLLIGLERVQKSRHPVLVVATASDPVPAAQVFLQLIPANSAEPGLTIGKKNVRVVGLPDGKMARHIEQLIRRKD